MTDGFMEPHPLWEYPSFPLSDIYEIFTLDFSENTLDSLGNVEKCLEMDIKNEGLLNGAAIWYVLEFDDEEENEKAKNTRVGVIDTGLLEAPIKGKHLKWSRDFKQAVHILEKKIEVNENSATKLKCTVKFEIKQASFKIDFKTD